MSDAGASRSAAQRPRVLLVDDCADTRDMYVEFLAERFEVVPAASGAEALAKAATFAPAVVVMDLSLPDMHGELVIEQMRKDPRMRRVPVVVVSGFPEPDSSVHPWDAYIVKPCLPDRLTACLDEMLRRAEQ